MSIFMQQPCVYPTDHFLTKDVGHSTGGVLSSSANRDDRTQISNLAERRRIQNRIAQCSHRRNQKNRLKDLKRQFGSSDTGSDKSKKTTTTKKPPRPKSRSQSHAAKPVASQDRFPPELPPMEPSDDLFFPGIFYGRARSNCPPPIEFSNNLFFPGTFHDRTGSNSPPQLTYSTSSAPDEILIAPDEILIAPYGATHPDTATISAASYNNFVIASTVPMKPPSMTQFDDTIRHLENSSPYNPFKNHTSLSHLYAHWPNCFQVVDDCTAAPQSMPGFSDLIYPQ